MSARRTSGGSDEAPRRRGRPPKERRPPAHPGLAVQNPLADQPPTARYILETARRLLVEHGYGALTLERVANESQESTATIRHHFGSKAGLIETLLDAVVHDAYVSLVTRVEQLPPGPARRRAYITGLRGIATDTQATMAIFHIAPHAVSDPILRERIAPLYEWYRRLTLVAAGLEPAGPGTSVEAAAAGAAGDAAAAGEVADDDARRRRATAAVIIGAIDGLSFQAALDPEGFDAEAAFDMLDEMVAAAMRVHGG